MKNIKRINKKNKADIGVNDVCNLMNEFLNINSQQGHHYQFDRISETVIALNGFHNNKMTAPIHALAYIIDTELDTNVLYTGINQNGVTFNKWCGKTWSEVYNALCDIL